MADLQLTLPFPRRRNWWPRCIRSWMRNANACQYFGKQHFYELKNRLLDRFGLFLGYNVQIIEIVCARCCGSGDFLWWLPDRYEQCRDCQGTGIFRVNYYLLERYLLFGDIYHRPIHLSDVKRFGRVGHIIKGKIVHPKVPYSRARKGFLLLSFIFDWNNFRIFLKQVYKEEINSFYKASFQLEELPF